ncbi:MAG: glycosyltransferase [Flavobacteriaceae bacterium]|nr:glycosyltransferase [Flavobacteriaceae bacterium]
MILTYYWPPSGGSGVQRWMYFAKYLVQLNWQVSVVTVDPKVASYPVLDDSLINHVKQVKTYRTKSFEPLRIYKWLALKSKKELPQGDINTKGFINKIFAFIRGNIFIPDARKTWNYHAFKKAKMVLNETPMNYLVTTGPPHSTHLIGLKLIKQYEIKWLVDFRDPWTSIFYNKKLYRTSWAKNKDAQYESRVLENADAILTTLGGAFHKELYQKTDKDQKFISIVNGYDRQLMSKTKSVKSQKFHVVYSGLLTSNQNFKIIIQVLEILQSKYPNKIKLTLAGNIGSTIINSFKNRLKAIEVIYLGYIPHHDSVSLIKQAHLLLAFSFEQASDQMISGKLLEYLSSGVPLIVIGHPKSQVAQIVNRGTHSRVYQSSDYNKIQNQFLKLIQAWLDNILIINHFEGISEYSRDNLTKKLEEVLLSL